MSACRVRAGERARDTAWRDVLAGEHAPLEVVDGLAVEGQRAAHDHVDHHAQALHTSARSHVHMHCTAHERVRVHVHVRVRVQVHIHNCAQTRARLCASQSFTSGHTEDVSTEAPTERSRSAALPALSSPTGAHQTTTRPPLVRKLATCNTRKRTLPPRRANRTLRSSQSGSAKRTEHCRRAERIRAKRI